MNVINNGRQLALLTRLEGEYKEATFTIIPNTAMPRMLQPGEYFFEYTNAGSILKEDLKSLWAIDSKGRIYKVPGRQIRGLKKAFAGMQEQKK